MKAAGMPAVPELPQDVGDTAGRSPKGRVGLVVLGSLVFGLVTAVVLAVLVFGGSEEPVISGVTLLSFALGWGLLALLSIRLTDQPQRWALVPAALMGACGLVYLVLQPSSSVIGRFGRVWPIALIALVVWMVWRSRRSLHNWSRRMILYPVFVVLAVSALGGGYETVREAQDESNFAMPGQLIDVGDHRLHINCTGSGSPTVVLEGGLGEPSTMMAGWIAPAVAATTTTCVYDRAGYGWSESASSPQDGLAVATDLHTLLTRAHAKPPFVLAGHSTGGVYVQIFAATYPGQVAGVVLLDSQPPDDFAKLPGYPSFYSKLRKGEALLPSLARLSLMRLFYSRAVTGLPPQTRAEERAFWSTADHYRTLHDEIAELPTSLMQAQALTSIGDLPLIVVTAGQDALTGWLPLQNEMAALSTNGLHWVMPGASHTSLTEDQGDSRISSRAIIDVVQAVRSGVPLTNP